MTDGQVFVFAAIAALALLALLDHLWRRRPRGETGWAIIVTQNGNEHISPVKTLAEAADLLDLEEKMHLGTGWTVDRYGATIRAAKGGTVRWIWIRPVT